MSDDLNKTTDLAVSTDQTDYAPGTTATFTAENVAVGDTVTFDVDHVVTAADGTVSTANDISGTEPWTVTDGGSGDVDGAANGTVVTTWEVNQDAADQTFVLTATDSSGATATVAFTDASGPNPNLDPSADPVDLTASTTVTINGALFVTAAFSQVSGTGAFPAFVQIDGNPDSTEQGYNYDAANLPAQFDEGNAAPHNHPLLLSDVTIVEEDGKSYYVFMLDSNEPNSDKTNLISLDALQVYTSSSGGLTDFDQPVVQGGAGTGFGVDASLVYDMDGAGNKAVILDSGAPGSGRPDLAVYIPVENFSGDPATTYVYLYSAFGYQGGIYDANSGFEEWGTVAGIDAGINIDKITGDGPNPPGTIVDDDGVHLTAGAPVVWTYTVTNAGNVALSNVTVTDDNGTVDTGDDSAATYVSGDANLDGKLDTTETWTFTATSTAVDTSGLPNGDYNNVGTASGTYLGLTVYDTDPSSYIATGGGGGSGEKGIDIEKTTQDTTDTDGVAAADAGTILVGHDILWTYTVTNTGFGAVTPSDLNLDHIVVTDDQLLFDIYNDGILGAGVGFSGDTNNDNILQVGETWVFTVAGQAAAGDYSNTGEAVGHIATETDPDATVFDVDTSNYFGAAPAIHIEKTTQDTTDTDGVAAANAGTILVGHDILWTYTVTNTGNVALSDVTVTDDNGTVGNTTDDIAATYVSGDTNTDGKLDTTETWIFSATGTAVANSYTNTGTAEGSFTDTALHETTVSDDATSTYIGAAPAIHLEKTTQDTTDTDGVAAANAGTILVGHDILWTYTVTNTGNVALSDVTVTDDNGTVGNTNDDIAATYVSGDTNTNGKLDTTETWIFSATGTAVANSYTNTGTAEGSFTDTALHETTVSDDATSTYVGADPEINVDKVTTGWLTPSTQGTGDGLTFLTGYGVTWTYTVTNAGNVALSNVSVIDNNGTVSTADDFAATYVSGDTDLDGKLDTTETWIYTASGTAGQGGYSNIATAKGSFTDTAGHKTTVDDTDTSGYKGIFIEDGQAWTKGFWGQHQEAWDGAVAVNKGKVDTQNLVDSGVLSHTDMLFGAGGVDSDGNGVINSGVYGVLLGDVNGNFKTDAGEDTLFVPLAAAQQIINSADSANDTRQILMSQALAAQLNIYNSGGEPNNLVTEAVKWLKGEAPYTYTDGSTGKVDTNGDGVLSASEYNTTTKAFTNDANGTLSGTALTSNLQAWQKQVDVTDAISSNVTANGEGLKNALMWFNDGHLVVSASGQVGWDADGVGGSNVVTHAAPNTIDDFWVVLGAQDVQTDLKGIVG